MRGAGPLFLCKYSISMKNTCCIINLTTNRLHIQNINHFPVTWSLYWASTSVWLVDPGWMQKTIILTTKSCKFIGNYHMVVGFICGRHLNIIGGAVARDLTHRGHDSEDGPTNSRRAAIVLFDAKQESPARGRLISRRSWSIQARSE